MKHTLPRLGLITGLALFGSVLSAECYADYKAKQDNPLRLHYGVADLSGPCSAQNARAELSPRLTRAGWTLLNVVSVFGPEGLAERKASAGRFYLRF